jgi:pimeloyl-ACP methyl ester carboxylesterase
MNNQNIEKINRPQQPKEPFPYCVEEVSYENVGDGITLSGTLTFPNAQPQSTFPVALLIAGYGSNDRDVTGMGHKYFMVLADYLTRKGIAVLRFDKRGVGKSTGDYTAVTSKELANDALSGVEYLKTRSEINHNQIGLIGLSEGGLIASMVAAQSKDVAFAVLMAPSVAMKVEDIVYHTQLQLCADGATEAFIESDRPVREAIYTIAAQEADREKAESLMQKIIADYLAKLPESQKLEAKTLPFAFTAQNASSFIKAFTSPAYRFFLTYDPSVILKQITVPVLALSSDRDWIMMPERAFPVLDRALQAAGNKDYTLLALPHLNHCFQTCKTGALAEYATIEETMSPVALKTIADWILERTINK